MSNRSSSSDGFDEKPQESGTGASPQVPGKDVGARDTPETEGGAQISQHGRRAPETTEPLRVLIVDDNADVARGMALLLRILGHDAEAVFSGPEALERIGRWRPRLVLLDLGMPEMDGYEVARQVRIAPGNTDLPLMVAVTGYDLEAVRPAAEAAGFRHVLNKPVQRKDLARLLEALT